LCRKALAQLLVAARAVPLAIADIGEGWIADEAARCRGLLRAMVARDFRHGALLAVNNGGDFHSTGAITGDLFGATHGWAR